MLINKLKKRDKVFIVSKNPGSGNIIASFVKKEKIKANYYLLEPSLKIFKDKKIKINNKNNSFFKKYKLLITGTSHENKFELKYISKAKKFNVYSVSFLDHWEKYKKRFKFNGKYFFPDELIAGDKKSFKLAKKEFKNHKLKISYIQNPYLEEIVKLKRKKNRKKGLVILSSNIDSLNIKLKDTKVFEMIIKKMTNFLKKNFINKIYIKNHPSERKKKFEKFCSNSKSKLSIKIKIIDKSLDYVLNNYQYVAGYDTMALVIAKQFGCNTFNLKLKGRKSTIPKKYIDKLI